jgi:hypothetical protein
MIYQPDPQPARPATRPALETTSIDYTAVLKPSPADLLQLKEWLRARNAGLKIEPEVTDDGVHFLMLSPRGRDAAPLWHLVRFEKTWVLYDPNNGAAFELVSAGEVSAFLIGHTEAVRRSWVRSPFVGISRPAPTQEELQAAKEDGMGLRGPKRRRGRRGSGRGSAVT